MAEVQVLGWGTQTAPSTRTTKAGENYDVLAIDATFDGSGAGGAFVPAVVIVSDAGQEVGTFPLSGSIAAGASATVTFAPFLRNGVGLSGIFYDFDNVGDWLNIVTTGAETGTSGMQLTAAKDLTITGNLVTIQDDGTAFANGVSINASGGASIHADPFNVLVISEPDCQFTMSHTGEIVFRLPAARAFTIEDNTGHTIFEVDTNGDLHGLTGKSLVFDR